MTGLSMEGLRELHQQVMRRVRRWVCRAGHWEYIGVISTICAKVMCKGCRDIEHIDMMDFDNYTTVVEKLVKAVEGPVKQLLHSIGLLSSSPG
mmetsp:Transcript_19961/g.43566  ORF Transcript_19961/g.43566 Transcript_19961/m.43566 type:complete len:93 (+) Transcript_19961:356-634(+)